MKKSKPNLIPDPICIRCGVKESNHKDVILDNTTVISFTHPFQDPAQAKFDSTLRKKGKTILKEAKIKSSTFIKTGHYRTNCPCGKDHSIETSLHKDKVIQKKRDIALQKDDMEQEVDYMADVKWLTNECNRYIGEVGKEKARNKKLKKIIWSIVGVVIIIGYLILR